MVSELIELHIQVIGVFALEFFILSTQVGREWNVTYMNSQMLVWSGYKNSEMFFVLVIIMMNSWRLFRMKKF